MTNLVTLANSARRRRLALVGAVLTLAVIWLGLLPWLATTRPVAQHIADQQRLGIDPSAMFYTELEIAPAIAHKAERRRAAGDLLAPPHATR